jgi:hypothetical protein
MRYDGREMWQKKGKRNAYWFCVGKHEQRARLEDPGVNGRIMLR